MRGAVCSMNLVYMLPPKAFSASNSQVNKARVAMPSLESHWCIYAGPNGVLCGAHASYCPTGTMVKRFCSGFKVIDGMDHSSNIKLSTLKLNEGSSRAGPHHDMPCPLPALVCGQGTSELIEGEWVRRAAGGRLVDPRRPLRSLLRPGGCGAARRQHLAQHHRATRPARAGEFPPLRSGEGEKGAPRARALLGHRLLRLPARRQYA